MFRLILLFAFVMSFSFNAGPNSQSFMEENDLWKEDSMRSSNISKDMFMDIVHAGLEAYKPVAKKWNERLTINARWDDATVNANASRWFFGVTINMYGGLARRSEVTPDGFALVLCHELNHVYGGTPYIYPEWWMSTEGQADYMGNGECIEKIFKEVAFLKYVYSPTSHMEDLCFDYYYDRENSNNNDNDYEEFEEPNECLRKVMAGQSLANLLATLKELPNPEYETPDELIVEKTNTSYPSVQCRLDTFKAGAFKEDRPTCWFKPEESENDNSNGNQG